MDAEAQKLMDDRFKSLPPELQKTLKSSDLPTKINIIGQRHQLHVDQMGKLRDEVVLYMMGFTEPEEFMAHLVQEVGVPTAVAGVLVQDISAEIMMPVIEAMKASDGAGVAAARTETPAPVSTPAPAPKPPTPPVSTMPPVPKTPEMHPADMMLSQKTVTVAPPTPPSALPAVSPKPLTPPAAPAPSTPAAPAAAKPTPPAPKPYSADPYREPIDEK